MQYNAIQSKSNLQEQIILQMSKLADTHLQRNSHYYISCNHKFNLNKKKTNLKEEFL